MAHIREISDSVDLFIAPSQYLLGRFRREFGLASEKTVYLDYGFDHERLGGRCRRREEDFVFGYIGTHTPQKGMNLLIEAFSRLRGPARLRLWGRSNGQVTNGLKLMTSRLPVQCSVRVEWLPEYRNVDIIKEVLNNVDAIVVPSIWAENSPLVIHEAQQARVPVIAANLGGMAEYVQHEVNGLLFAPRDSVELARQMQRFVDDPDFAARLGKRGYIKSDSGDVPSIEEHVGGVTSLYERVLHPLRVIA
jgi:glycosyltransferase involved in cell wall biosynthesis